MSKSMKVSSSPLKGMLDDYPKQYEQYQQMKTVIDKIARLFCYEQYASPVMESLAMYENRTSREILEEQSYVFTDKGGRKVILRPEVTQSLARMVAQKIKEATLPLRWYSVMKCYRYERPQKGRLREFRQLNFDLLSETNACHALVDLEIFQIIYTLMKSFNVPNRSYKIYYNHRGLINALLDCYGFSNIERVNFYKLIDKKDKMNPKEFDDSILENFLHQDKQEFIANYVEVKNLADLIEKFPLVKEAEAHKALLIDVHAFVSYLEQLPFELAEQMEFKASTVRGLDYYTGIVFEVFDVATLSSNDKNASLEEPPLEDAPLGRSLFGGGRYDNLVEQFSNQSVSGIGFGMGIHIMMLFLKRLDCFFSSDREFLAGRYFIAHQDNKSNADDDNMSPFYLAALSLATSLRESSLREDKLRADSIREDSIRESSSREADKPQTIKPQQIELHPKPLKLAKALRKANQSRALYFIFVGEDELKQKIYRCRNLKLGSEQIKQFNYAPNMPLI